MKNYLKKVERKDLLKVLDLSETVCRELSNDVLIIMLMKSFDEDTIFDKLGSIDEKYW